MHLLCHLTGKLGGWGVISGEDASWQFKYICDYILWRLFTNVGEAQALTWLLVLFEPFEIMLVSGVVAQVIGAKRCISIPGDLSDDIHLLTGHQLVQWEPCEHHLQGMFVIIANQGLEKAHIHSLDEIIGVADGLDDGVVEGRWLKVKEAASDKLKDMEEVEIVDLLISPNLWHVVDFHFNPMSFEPLDKRPDLLVDDV